MAFLPGEGFRRLEGHLARLAASAAHFGFPLDVRRVEQALRAGRGAGAGREPRPARCCTPTAASRCRRPRCSRHARPPAPRRASPRAPSTRRSVWLLHKTTRREVYDEARASRPDCDDVLLWNDRGEVTEAARRERDRRARRRAADAPRSPAGCCRASSVRARSPRAGPARASSASPTCAAAAAVAGQLAARRARGACSSGERGASPLYSSSPVHARSAQCTVEGSCRWPRRVRSLVARDGRPASVLRRAAAPRRRGERHVLARGRGVLQLQRLRRPATSGCSGSTSRPRLRLAPVASILARRADRQPPRAPRLRALPAPAALGGPRARPAGRARAAGVRRVSPAALRLREPAAERAARLPVPDDRARGRGAVAGARTSSRSGAAAGWCATRSGEASATPGLPLVDGEALGRGRRAAARRASPLSLAVAVTQGTLCHPLVRDDNGGKQVSGRLAWTPGAVLVGRSLGGERLSSSRAT